MGQYHRLVNLDKKEVVLPSGLGFGTKQYEHTSVEGSLSDAMYLLATCSPNRGGGDFPLTDVSGSWVGDRIVVVGDYTIDEDIPDYPNASQIFGDSGVEEGGWTDITDKVRSAFETIFGMQYKYVELSGYGYWERQFID